MPVPPENTPKDELRDDELILYYYGETRREAEIRRRLAASADARRRYDELCRVLAAVDALPVPEPGPGYGERVWNRLRAELEDDRARPSWWKLGERLAGVAAPARLRTAAALAAALAVAFAAGHYWPPSKPADDPAVLTEESRERIVMDVVADHFERSQRLLLELANAPGGAAVDVTLERESAEHLLDANRLYRQTTRRAGQADLADVLDELERLLLDLAHGPEEIAAEDLEDYRSRIDDVLFKVQVLGWRLRQEERQPRLSPSPPPPAGDQA